MSEESKVVLFIASSLDGYIAKDDDSLDWLFKAEEKGEGDNGYLPFYDSIDTILMGRKTYDQILILENGIFPYIDKDCYVFSRSAQQENDNVKFIDEDLAQFVDRLKKSHHQIWLVGGGELVHTFMKDKLIDELIITIIPILLGRGISLFKESDMEIKLNLKKTEIFNQFVQLHYKVE